MRKTTSRRKVTADQFMLMFTEACTKRGVYHPNTGFDDVVSINGVGKKIAIELLKDLYEDEVKDWERGRSLTSHLKKGLNPREWRYTTHNFRMVWLVHVRKDNHSRPITLWPGRKLVASCVDKPESLAKRTRKILNERLRRLVGNDQYDFWLRIEAPRGKPNDVHFHGFLEMYDLSWWEKSKYEKLRQEIKAGVGLDCAAKPNKQLYIRRIAFDANWLRYSAKQRKRNPILQKRPPYLDEKFVEPWEAQTRRLRTRAIERHAEVREVIKHVLNS